MSGQSSTAVMAVAARPDVRRPRRPPLVAAVVVVIAVLVVLTAVAWRWWTHPTVFGDLGDSFIGDPQPLRHAALSTTVVFPRAGAAELITVGAMRATFSTNTSRARASFWVCHQRPGQDPIGAVQDPDTACEDKEPFVAPLTFVHGPPPRSDYLFVTITPVRPGTAHLESVEITYRRGADHAYQHGTQSIRVDRTVRAS